MIWLTALLDGWLLALSERAWRAGQPDAAAFGVIVALSSLALVALRRPRP